MEVSNMPSDKRGLSELIYPEGGAGAAPLDPGDICIVVNAAGRKVARSKADLATTLEERPVNSVAELCQAFDVRVRGSYPGIDGEPVEVSIPVADESTFTPDGLTRADEGLYRLYVGAVTCDNLALYLSGRDREGLTTEEIQILHNIRETLARASEKEAS
jgi:hypothetical protein